MVEVDAGFTVLKFRYYSVIKNIPVGHAVPSNEFTAGGLKWKVYCYPHGPDEETDREGYLSLSFQLLSGAKEVKAIMEAFVIGSNFKPSSSYGSKRRMAVFRQPNSDVPRCPGWTKFEKRCDLESSECIVDGWLTLMCGVVVHHENSILPNSIDVPSSDIQNHLGNLLETADGADVSFFIDGEEFHAHRAVLAARSPVFRAELLGPMAEAKMSCITLHDIEPAAFEVLLQFMYTDVLPGDDKLGNSAVDMFQHLLAAADRYALNRLKLICAQKLWENMSVDIVASALACAETYNSPELRNRCIDFVAADNNFKKVVLTEGFMQLALRFPSIIAELKQRIGA